MVVVKGHLLRVVNWNPSDTSLSSNEETRFSATQLPTPQPSNYTGPAHLQPLVNSCYEFSDEKYKYQICLFKSISQKEIGGSTHLLSLTRSLGVWKSWEIEDGQFKALLFEAGSVCGSNSSPSGHRQSRVELRCGPRSQITSVEEPRKCYYTAVLVTPYVCGDDSVMAVYPRLSSLHRRRWDQVYTDWENGLVTDLGYNKTVHLIYKEAGLVNDASDNEQRPMSCDECRSELEELKRRVQQLKSELFALRNL
ncbi:Mannose-6-phosphate receptor binding domain [Trinorchestia longiramus]|nr:Mannose-6-phosphate receptor binding domain [Trinorchestia longiramus]